MKRLIFIGFAMMMMASQTIFAQKKKAQNIKVFRIIHAPAEKVWKVIAEDYGAIANSHPKIVNSNYINGTLKAGEGAERVCNFNEKGTQFLREKQVDYNPAEYSYTNQVFQAGKFPLDPEYTFGLHKVEPIDANTCRYTISADYRTKPAFMGGMVKGSFKKLLTDYMIAVEHHVSTGETVNKDNFKEIKKQYKKKS